MPDVNIKYKGNSIGSLSDSGTKTLKTQGKYLEGDVAVEYTKPSGGEEADLYASADAPANAEDGSYWVDFSEDIPPEIDVEPKNITENGTYTAPSGKAYSPVTVNVPTGTPRSSADLTVSGRTVTAPAGLYSDAASKSVPAGTQGTPTATKSINGTTATVTPRATGTTGYITGTTKTGTAVTVTAAELDTLGTKSINANGTGIDVTGYSAVDVAVPGSEITVEPLPVSANGTYTAPAGKAYSPVTVNVAGGGGLPTASAKAVNFIDYDGTIRYSYTAAEFAALSAMPANPTHDGLTSQGWNWALSDAQTYVAKYGRLWIGQMYITDDGKTRVYIHLEEGRTSPILGCRPNGTVDVDWGDGTAHETLTGTSTTTVMWTPTHNYAAPGDYVIKLTVSGSMGFYGSSSTNQYGGLLRYSSGEDSRNHAYRNAIQRVEIGGGVTSIGSNAFDRCYSLASMTVPDGVTSIGTYAFQYCYSLASVTIPDSVTSIGSNAFDRCYSLASVTVPDGATSIGSYAFQYCYSLASVTIPSSVTSIVSSTFSGCYSLASVTVPDGVTSIGSYAFQYCYSLASVTVPDGVTSIVTYAFQYCYSLASVTIPDSVTSIGSNAFDRCYSLAIVRFLPQTPPTVSNANAFTSIPTDCVIYVPHGTLSAYTSATNYPDPATYTYVEDPV